MLKIAIIDTIGLTYDGDTLSHQGLGGSESAVILLSKELAKIGFEVTVYNNCIDSRSSPGIFDGVEFIDHEQQDRFKDYHDIVISSRSVFPFFAGSIYNFIPKAKRKILWMHDTFCQGDEHIEPMLVEGIIDEIFTLSDWHTVYTLTNNHGQRRMFEVLKHKNFLTRNGAVKHVDEVDVTQKDPNHFVFNASVTKGLNPLLKLIWPDVKRLIPEAHLTVIGGYYRFRDNAEPDEQEKDLINFQQDETYKKLNIRFTGVITQKEIAHILANATYMIYPSDFPETFGISSLESLLYKTPLITCRFGALEETAIDLACYKIDYPSVPNGLFPHINETEQADKFIKLVHSAYNTPYLLMQKQNYCDVLNDIHSWKSIALQWKQHLYMKLGLFLPAEEFRQVDRINKKVNRIFNRKFVNEVDRRCYQNYGNQKKITIITPFYNAESYIENCILSVVSQDYENYKFMLIDDASTDNSLQVVKSLLAKLPVDIQKKIKLTQNFTNMGAVYNHWHALQKVDDDNIILLLDGDDWLVNNNTIFNFYNNLYQQGIEFAYGSCYSLADNIPLIAQNYPNQVKNNKTYRSHKFPWNMPYTHLRTFTKSLFNGLGEEKFKDTNGDWLRAGGDGALFYELIERADPNKVIAVKEILYNYNDLNPLNDYKVNSEEQTRNANYILANEKNINSNTNK
jgi:glycosyltransferase involved in cell wall biosynthesis